MAQFRLQLYNEGCSKVWDCGWGKRRKEDTETEEAESRLRKLKRYKETKKNVLR